MLTLVLAFAQAQVTQHIIPVTMIKQQRSQWCWAACAAMLDKYYFPAIARPQCELVEYYLEQIYDIDNTLNCSSAVPGSHNESRRNDTGNAYFSYPMDYFGKRYERILSYNGLYSSFEISPTAAEIKAEINNNRPMIVFLSLSGDSRGSGHIVLVKGYREEADGTLFLLLNDPWFHNPVATISPLTEINYSALSTVGTVRSFQAFQINIHPKLVPITATPGSFARNVMNVSFDNVVPPIKEDTITIPVKILSIDKLRGIFSCLKRQKFLKNQIIELYLPGSRKTIMKEKTEKGWVTTEIREANYPTHLHGVKGQDSLIIDDIAKGNVTLWQYPAPPFPFFYEVVHNKEKLVFPLLDFSFSNDSTQKVEAGKYYKPHEIYSRLRRHNAIFFGKGIFSNLNSKGMMASKKDLSRSKSHIK